MNVVTFSPPASIVVGVRRPAVPYQHKLFNLLGQVCMTPQASHCVGWLGIIGGEITKLIVAIGVAALNV